VLIACAAVDVRAERREDFASLKVDDIAPSEPKAQLV
jgi:hypothetical protein